MEFEESLPSHSTFLKHEAASSNFTGNWTQDINDMNGRRSPSPPPPPPPLPASASEDVLASDRQGPRRAAEESNKPSDGKKFPFLRKNSRKEPSALHRVNSPTKSPSSSSPTSADHYEYNDDPERVQSDSRQPEPSKYQLSSTAPPTAQRPTPASITAPPAQRPVPMSTGRDRLDETDYSTISITGDNWRKQQAAHANELEEFEQIERQVQLGSSLAFSGSQSINAATLQQARRPAPQPIINELDESVDSGGWDVPEDLGASQRTTIRVRSDDEAVRWQDTGAHSAATYIGEQYGDDDPLMNSYQDATQYPSHSSPTRTNRSSEEEHDAVSPPAAPGAADVDTGDYGRTSSSMYRTADSPSWGRVTQPADTSFDSDSEYPPDSVLSSSRGASLSATTTPGARMSESTLRKISSRTAALHHNTRPTIERPTLADDTMGSIDAHVSEYSAGASTIRPGSVSRPLSTQRRLANTLAGSTPHGANNRSRSAGRGSPRTGGTVATAAEFTKDMHVLEAKAKELEDEIQAYRSKNAALDKLHKQQKAALAEVLGQKDEVLRWAAEEKLRTQKYCEEQQAAAHKERNSVAKLAREIRQKASATPIRKEKAEVEALQATIEKMKIEHEQAVKKHKLNEQRLTTNNAAQAAHIAELDRQILAIDEDNLRLREFIQKEGILLPKHLRIAPQRAGSTSSPKAATSRGFGGGAGSGGKARSIASSRAYYGEEGYVEEVDVDVVENVSSSRHYADGGAAAVAQAAAPTKTLSTTLGMPKNSSTVQSSTSRPGTGTGKAGGLAGDVFNQQASNLRSSSAARGGRQSAPSGARDSWARSSRSSRSSAGGRYDEWEASDRDDSFLGKEVAVSASASHPHSGAATTQKEEPASAPGSGAAGTGRTEEDLPDGGKVIRYKNGTEKRVDKAGNSVVNFLNGDTKTVNVVTGSVVYFYAEAKTTHTTYGDGLEVYEFPNGQVEMQFPDGIKEIVFPDNTRKVIHPDGLQESHFPDGVLLREHPDGRREVLSKDDVESRLHH